MNSFLHPWDHFTGRDSALPGEVNVTFEVLQGDQISARLCQELCKHTWKAAATPEHSVMSVGG